MSEKATVAIYVLAFMQQESTDNIKKKAFSGAFWKFAERISAQLVMVVVTIVLARILLPEDYGTIAIVSIFFAFCNVIISGGLNSALIQKKNSDIIDYSTVLVASTFLAGCLYLIVFLCAPFIAGLYNKPILVPLFRIMAITFFIYGYKAVVSAYVSSNLLFKKFFYSTLTGTVVSGIIGVAMAIKGYGPWALAAQQMSNAIVDSVVLTLVTGFKVRWIFSWERFRPLFAYGWKILASSVIAVLYEEIKPLIVGYKYSDKDLAFYSNGKLYPQQLNSSISATLAAVLFPVIAKFQEDKSAVLNVTSRYMKMSSYVIAPVIIGFGFTADNFMSVFLTDKWLPAVPFARVFCFAYLLDLVQNGNLQAIRAIGRSDIILKLEIIKKTFYFIVIVIFIIFTNSPLLLASTEIICALAACMINAYPNRTLICYGYRKQVIDILPNIIIALIMGIVVYCVGLIEMNKALLLVAQVIVGFIVYLTLSIITKNPNYIYLKNLALSGLSRGKANG